MRHATIIFRIVILASAVLFQVSRPQIEAQETTTGRLTVSVVDTTEAVIPRAIIKAFSGQQEVARQRSGPDGKAVLTLIGGVYEIRAEASGFRSENVQLDIAGGSCASHTFQLRVAVGSAPIVVHPAVPFEPSAAELDAIWLVPSVVPRPMKLEQFGAFIDALFGVP